MTSRTPLNRQELIKVYRQAAAEGKPLELVDKQARLLIRRSQAAEATEQILDEERQDWYKHQVPAVVRYSVMIIPLFFLTLGAILVGSAVMPVISYAVTSAASPLGEPALVAPVPADQVLDVNPMMIVENQKWDSDAEQLPSQPVVIDNSLDYTNLANWFTGGDLSFGAAAEQTEVYYLDIPKLKITNAKVEVGGTDLSHSLIQYPGTALPGELGAPVVFGHSVLRQFYNPAESNSRRYTSIFSTIMTLTTGDEIIVRSKGVTYTYRVVDKLEVKPTDTYILNQQFDSRQLKLVTCTPEGTYLRRGIVVAQLVQ